MKKVLIITVGLLVAFGSGCASKRDKTAEKQLKIAEQLGEEIGIDSKTMANDIVGGLKLETGEITHLDLSGRNLTALPPEIGLLTGLEELDLRNNKLTELPEEIGNLKRLKKLDVSINKLIKLPESIGNLESLEELECGENKIADIPQSIGNLTNLKRLYLDINKITRLPLSMSNMKNSDHLALAFNPIVTVPKVLGELPVGTEITLSPEFDSTSMPLNIKHNMGGMYSVGNH
jgi:Leucine-rich repeat (LRR) protein